jgi:hypothetical protein
LQDHSHIKSKAVPAYIGVVNNSLKRAPVATNRQWYALKVVLQTELGNQAQFKRIAQKAVQPDTDIPVECFFTKRLVKKIPEQANTFFIFLSSHIRGCCKLRQFRSKLSDKQHILSFPSRPCGRNPEKTIT